MKSYSRANLALLLTSLLLAAGCSRPPEHHYQGYLEGEFIYVASPLAGRLETLAVTKGRRVDAGAPLFTLERSAELATQQQASDQLRSAQARLEDLRKGSRPTELAALEARLEQARATVELSKLDLERQAGLFKSHVISDSDFDRARLTHERNLGTITELNAWVTSTRETSEVRQQTEQMGRSMVEWLKNRGLADERIAQLGALKPAPTWPVAFALAAAQTGAPLREALLSFAFSWAENMVQAALKAVPLGQNAGQRVLAALAEQIPDAVDHAMRLMDSERQAFMPMLAILSAQHETQYSRLFRS